MNKLMPVPKVYLAGGMRSNWQDRVTAFAKERNLGPVMWLDPRHNGGGDEHRYTSWDLAGVETADVLLVYLEADNPGGHGLALEIGFACGMARAGAKPKHIIFACDPSHPQARYFGMARACADEVFETLEQALEAFESHLVSRY